MIKAFLTFPLIFALANAEISFESIQSKPSGRSKNFMIWQYLKQDISAKEADAAYELVEGNIHKIKKQYLKKSKNKKLLKEIECRGRQDLLSITEKDCFKLAMSPYKTLKMDKDSRKKLLDRLESKAAKDAVRIQSEVHEENSYFSYDSNTILDMFIRTNSSHRRNNLNFILSEKFIDHMFSLDASPWKKFALIKIIVNDDKLDKLQKSLLELDFKNVGADSNFLLALNLLRHDQPKKAIKYFEFSRNKYTRRISKDKNTFWMYQVTHNKKYLKELLLSTDINIYSLYANDKLGKEVQNYFSLVETTNEKSKKNICDPFEWDEIVKEIKESPKDNLINLADKYNQHDMAPVQSFIVQKAHAFKMHGYIMPYDEYLEDISIDDKALVYALMRQESNMIPSALSRSFALGLMQIMPFVTDDLSTRMKNPITCYDDMFEPEHNLKYALKHYTWLKKTYYHPLFFAYAYNGGIGYFRRHLQAGTFLKGKYEPFMSMELMSNKESREYGKRVLANYVMYKKILGEDISIVALLSTLTDPKKTDRYRSSK